MEPVRLAPPRLASVVSARLAEAQDNPSDVHSFAVVPIAALDLAALHALAYAVSLGQPVLAVHVSPTEQEAERFQRSWQAWGDHLPLEVLVSPYRATVAPLANYIAALHRQRPDLTLTLVVPEIVVAKPWQRILHNRIAARLRASLIAYEGIIITTVPFHLPGERVPRATHKGCLASPPQCVRTWTPRPTANSSGGGRVLFEDGAARCRSQAGTRGLLLDRGRVRSGAGW